MEKREPKKSFGQATAWRGLMQSFSKASEKRIVPMEITFARRKLS